jgi:hypothetical protein
MHLQGLYICASAFEEYVVLAIMSLITDAIKALLKLKNQILKGQRKLNDNYSIVLEF